MKAGDKIQVMVSDRHGVWLDAEVYMVNKYDRPGVVLVDEGVPVPFQIQGGRQILFVFDNNDGTLHDLIVPHRKIRFQAASCPASS